MRDKQLTNNRTYEDKFKNTGYSVLCFLFPGGNRYSDSADSWTESSEILEIQGKIENLGYVFECLI